MSGFGEFEERAKQQQLASHLRANAKTAEEGLRPYPEAIIHDEVRLSNEAFMGDVLRKQPDLIDDKEAEQFKKEHNIVDKPLIIQPDSPEKKAKERARQLERRGIARDLLPSIISLDSRTRALTDVAYALQMADELLTQTKVDE